MLQAAVPCWLADCALSWILQGWLLAAPRSSAAHVDITDAKYSCLPDICVRSDIV